MATRAEIEHQPQAENTRPARRKFLDAFRKIVREGGNVAMSRLRILGENLRGTPKFVEIPSGNRVSQAEVVATAHTVEHVDEPEVETTPEEAEVLELIERAPHQERERLLGPVRELAHQGRLTLVDLLHRATTDPATRDALIGAGVQVVLKLGGVANPISIASGAAVVALKEGRELQRANQNNTAAEMLQKRYGNTVARREMHQGPIEVTHDDFMNDSAMAKVGKKLREIFQLGFDGFRLMENSMYKIIVSGQKKRDRVEDFIARIEQAPIESTETQPDQLDQWLKQTFSPDLFSTNQPLLHNAEEQAKLRPVVEILQTLCDLEIVGDVVPPNFGDKLRQGWLGRLLGRPQEKIGAWEIDELRSKILLYIQEYVVPQAKSFESSSTHNPATLALFAEIMKMADPQHRQEYLNERANHYMRRLIVADTLGTLFRPLAREAIVHFNDAKTTVEQGAAILHAQTQVPDVQPAPVTDSIIPIPHPEHLAPIHPITPVVEAAPIPEVRPPDVIRPNVTVPSPHRLIPGEPNTVGQLPGSSVTGAHDEVIAVMNEPIRYPVHLAADRVVENLYRHNEAVNTIGPNGLHFMEQQFDAVATTREYTPAWNAAYNALHNVEITGVPAGGFHTYAEWNTWYTHLPVDQQESIQASVFRLAEGTYYQNNPAQALIDARILNSVLPPENVVNAVTSAPLPTIVPETIPLTYGPIPTDTGFMSP